MSTQIRVTKDYSIFDLHEVNRDVKNTKNLENSMAVYGWIDAYPMHVVRNGDKRLKIKAGHHRFKVAKRLGIPVKFVVVDNDDVGIHELEKTAKQWSVSDYLQSYVRAGYKDYHIVKEYHERTGIGISNCISMLGGNQAGTGNFQEKFKDGNFIRLECRVG